MIVFFIFFISAFPASLYRMLPNIMNAMRFGEVSDSWYNIQYIMPADFFEDSTSEESSFDET